MIKQTAGRKDLGEFAPEFARLNDDVLFGEEWNRVDKLSMRDRCIVTVTALMSKGILDSSLQYHIQNAKNHGVTATEMAEILTHAAFYAGWPNAWAAFRMAKEVYAEGREEIGELDKAGVKRWHGAASASGFSHLAVEVPGENTSKEWCESVVDEEYGKLK